MNRPVPSFTAWSACVLALVLVASPRAAFAQRGPVPSLGYFVGKGHLAAGEYPSALRIFHGELAGGIKSTLGRGTDAVAYYAARGEARYHMGQYKQALDDFNAALNVFQSRPNWMVSVNFPAAIRPAAPGQIQNAPWGRSTRGAALGFYPDSYNSMQGQINAANNVLRQGGGVVQQARLVPVNAAELVRATALALRRRRELLGPTGRFDPLTGELISSLVGPVAPPTSWSRAWADVMLGMAYGAAGKDAQAKQVLVKGHLAAGQFDHPLTAQALFELGRIELTAGDYQRATYFFTEASYSAYQYFDPMLIEEAVRYAQITHLMANNKGVCPLLTGVSTWAKRSTRYSHLKASLAILTAENLSVRNDARSTKALAEAAQIMKRARGLPASPMGARYNFTAAMLYYQKGKVSDGDAALNAALVFQKNGGSLWLHHLSLAKKLAVTTELSGRETYTVLGNLLRDPQPADWLSNPLEALSVLVTPHPEVYEMWFDVANSSVLKRKEAAFQIADLTRRHRFYSTLQFGGRLLSLRWVLEAPEASISKAALLQRQELLAQFPQYAALQQQTARFQEQLAKLPLAPKEPDVLDQQKQLLASLAAARGGQEAILRLMAVRRYPSAMIFPPRRTVKEVQEGLANDSAALVFFYSAFRRHFYAYVISKTEFADFEVGSYDAIRPKLEALLRDMGHQDKNKALSLKILKDPQWRKSSKDLLTQLFRNGGGLPTDVQELAIVPDGLLWYVPFEALGASAAPGLNSWISRVRIRYAPTAGLIHGDRRGQPRNPSTAVLLGQLYPRDSAQVAEQAYQEFSRSVSGSQRIHRDEPLAGPSSLFKGMFDRLVVFDEIDPPSAGAYSWVPMAGRNHSGGTLDSWLGLPWKGPDAAIFPAFHSRAEDAGNLSGLNPNVAGNELFLSVCGLMASGSRTIVLSRWRTGGYTSYELIREFTQELGRSSPAEAWQRSVFLASETQIRPDAEPRIDVPPNVEPPNASHPFFWSGYLLVDSSQPAQAADEAGGQPNSKQEEKRRILERINQDLENKK